MLDDYKYSQPIAYKILTNSIKKQRVSHAYLIETNEYPKKMDFALSFAKFLLCKENYTNHDHCGQCNLCHRIDNGNFTELKIINPDGMWIKKEQLVALQNEFSKKSIESDKKVYIINQAEKLNASAANSILKFLEEPEPNIFAILLTDNIYQLLDTIVSRCQIISLHKPSIIQNEKYKSYSPMLLKIAMQEANNVSELENILNNEQFLVLIESAVKFVHYYEKNHANTLLNINALWTSIFLDKEKMIFGLDVMVLYYKDLLNRKLHRTLDIFMDDDKMQQCLNNNTIYEICNKIKIIIETKQKIRYNMNQHLLIDKMILRMEGMHHEKSSESRV